MVDEVVFAQNGEVGNDTCVVAKAPSLKSEIWAVTAYFCAAESRIRPINYRRFRDRLEIPLLAVELSFGNGFELDEGDAEILVQVHGTSVMWQKERLLNVALERLPPHVTKVVWLDGDVVFREAGWSVRASKALDEVLLVEDETESFDANERLLARRSTRFLKFVRGAGPVHRPSRVWTPEELEAIHEDLERQRIPLKVPDGPEFDLLRVGPCTTEDFIAWQAATGAGPFVKAFDEHQRVVRKNPGLYFADEHGSPMSYAMVHRDLGAAQHIGASRCFDFGRLRSALVERGFQRFAGYRVTFLEIRLHDFVYTGERLIIRAERLEREGDAIRFSFACENQDGQSNASGTAVVSPV